MNTHSFGKITHLNNFEVWIICFCRNMKLISINIYLCCLWLDFNIVSGSSNWPTEEGLVNSISSQIIQSWRLESVIQQTVLASFSAASVHAYVLCVWFVYRYLSAHSDTEYLHLSLHTISSDIIMRDILVAGVFFLRSWIIYPLRMSSGNKPVDPPLLSKVLS